MRDADGWSRTAETALRERLHGLARAAGVAAPLLTVEHDPQGTKVSARVHRDDNDGRDRIVVSSALLDASDAEQTWHLATCLSWWTSREPRRRRLVGRLALAVPLGTYAGLSVASLTSELPGVWAAVLGFVAGEAFLIALAGHLRGLHRALDAAGRTVLAAAGYDPATLARRTFGGWADPPWWKQLHSRLPPPSERLRAAEQRSARLVPPLH